MSCGPGHYDNPPREKRRKKQRRRRDDPNRKSGAGYVLLSEFPHIDAALKFLRMTTQDVLNEWRNRQHYSPKPTRDARKRRGILLEKRRAGR